MGEDGVGERVRARVHETKSMHALQPTRITAYHTHSHHEMQRGAEASTAAAESMKGCLSSSTNDNQQPRALTLAAVVDRMASGELGRKLVDVCTRRLG